MVWKPLASRAPLIHCGTYVCMCLFVCICMCVCVCVCLYVCVCAKWKSMVNRFSSYIFNLYIQVSIMLSFMCLLVCICLHVRTCACGLNGLHLCARLSVCVCVCMWGVVGVCCRHFPPIMPNATWQLWIRLPAIQGYSLHYTQTHARTSLCSYKTSLYIHKQMKAKAVGLNSAARSAAFMANAVTGRHVNVCLFVVNEALWEMCVLSSRYNVHRAML